MSSSAVQGLTDPYDYAPSIRGTKAELTVIGRGDFAAKIIRIDFDQLWMQRFSENLPRILHSANSNGRTVISFQTHAGPPLVRGGVEVRSNSQAQLGKDYSHFQPLGCCGLHVAPIEVCVLRARRLPMRWAPPPIPTPPPPPLWKN